MQENDVKLINIGATDVHDGNLKLILGMIWTLISQFSIVAKLKSLGSEKTSAKQLLLQASRDMYNIN